MVNWQRRKSLERLISLCHAPQASAGVQHNNKPVRAVTSLALTASAFLLIGGVALLIHYFGFHKTLLPKKIFHAFGESLEAIAIFVFLYTNLIWIICMAAFVSTTMYASSEFAYLNKKLKQMEEATHNQIYGKLLGFFDTHRELARSVRLINHTFSVSSTFFPFPRDCPAWAHTILMTTARPCLMTTDLLAMASQFSDLQFFLFLVVGEPEVRYALQIRRFGQLTSIFGHYYAF
ncbi:unnamed protein product [Gongylonema pulchrum]|uniref:Uncharacterized protein n=1 Tax=Gongylonema pulchrum TaxID=637853 RepID=A0A183DBS8_9BILA|nr:unnamed protein product [Gongylonema pulchrum]